MSDLEYECPACSGFGYDPGNKCMRCGYLEGHGVTQRVQAKLNELSSPLGGRTRHQSRRDEVLPKSPKPRPIRFTSSQFKELTARSFAPKTPYMIEREEELRLARESEIRRAERSRMVADMRGGAIFEPLADTLTEAEFVNRLVPELLRDEAPIETISEMRRLLERYWFSNQVGSTANCINIEYQIADYLNNLPEEHKAALERVDGDSVAQILVRYARSGIGTQEG